MSDILEAAKALRAAERKTRAEYNEARARLFELITIAEATLGKKLELVASPPSYFP
jgi:hypothetical protein